MQEREAEIARLEHELAAACSSSQQGSADANTDQSSSDRVRELEAELAATTERHKLVGQRAKFIMGCIVVFVVVFINWWLLFITYFCRGG